MVLKYRKDYIAPHYKLPLTELDFTLDATQTIVRSKLHFKQVDCSKPLILDGQHMTLKSIQIDGRILDNSEYVF